MSLKEYEKKRSFKKSPEPRGEKKKSGGQSFVIQKHDASRLHFDLRIESDGVLKSWAVPKGPSTDPSQKRLAVPTEDHPLEYADFEGVIPEGEYGGGTVMVWDHGTYENLRDKSVKESLKQGRLRIYLKGEKIRGGYSLIKAGKDGNWLLVKSKDEEADARRNPVSTENRSVKSGRTMTEIEKDGGS